MSQTKKSYEMLKECNSTANDVSLIKGKKLEMN